MMKLSTLRVSLRTAILTGIAATLSSVGNAQLSVTTMGVAVTQPFTIGTTATPTLPTGWRMEGTAASSATDWASLGTATTLAYGSTGLGAVTSSSTGGAINWANGVTGSATDRSIGFLNTGTFTSPKSIAFRFTNNTGSTITSLAIAFDYEKTRSGSRQFDWTFFHGSATNATTAATAGDQSYAADANNTTISNPPTTISKSFTLSGLSIADGTSYTLRWTYTGLGGNTNGQGIGIDNFSMTPSATTNTNVQFTGATSTLNESAASVNIPITITNPHPMNSTSVTITAAGSTGRITSFTSPVIAGGGATSANCVVVPNNNSLCDGNQTVTFTIAGVSGGQGSPTFTGQLSNVLTVNNDDFCTNVSFAVTSATVGEGSVTYVMTANITDYSTTQATTVDVVLTSGNAARVNGFSSQTLTFLANSPASQSVSLTITDNSSCLDGNQTLTFGLENIAGGQGTPTVGPSRTLTINDNDAVSGEVIARQAFDGLGSDTWAITAGASNISTTPGAGNTPANQRILSGTASWQVNSANSTLDLSTIDVSGYSNVVLQVRLTGTSVNGTNGVDGPDLVRAFIALNGGAFPGTADITVAGNNNARYGYGSTGVATTIAGTPASFAPAAGGNITDGYATINISIPSSTSTIALRVTALNDVANEVWSVDDIQVTGDRCTTTYYSRGSGNVGAAIWSDSPSGGATSVTFDRFKSMHIQSGNTVTVDANTKIEHLNVNTGGTLNISSGTTLTVKGWSFVANGTLTGADNSTVELTEDDNLTSYNGTGTNSFYNFTVNTPLGCIVLGNMDIRGTLQLVAGNFEANSNTVHLRSTASGTGRLGPVPPGVLYIGVLDVERYIPAGRTNWRLMGSPILGLTVADWQDDFITAGYPGSQVPGFSNPVGSGHLWPSVRKYNEAYTYPSIDSLWVGVSSSAETLNPGKGFAAWCGTGEYITTAFTVDMWGTPNVASSPINVALSYTNTGQSMIDGWNAVSNPLPSPILFSNISRTNVEPYVHIYNPAAGNTATYTIGGFSTLGGTDMIQSSQAFLVKATGGSASIGFEEADKVLGPQGGFFGGDQLSTFNGLSLKISGAVNTFFDETVLVFSEGTPGLESSDVPKMTFAHPEAPQIATMTADGDLIAVNTYGEYSTDISVPVMVNVALSGTYTVAASNMENLGLTCLILEDLQTGTMTPLVEGATYSFAINADDDATAPRLMLHASAPVPLYVDAATCNASNDGSSTVVHVGDEPMDITWTDAAGDVFLQQTIADGIAVVSDLEPGAYTVSVSSAAGCGSLHSNFSIEAPAAIEATAETHTATCASLEDGSLDLTVLGGVAPFTYAWSNGTTDEDLVDVAAAAYTVTVTDANDCMLSSDAFIIPAGPGPLASATVESNTVMVNTALAFTNTTVDAEFYTWNFGDDTTSPEMNPEHAWSEPGTYTVTLTATNGNCTDVWTAEVVVETSTSIATSTDGTTLNAWYANDKFVVEHNFDNGEAVIIEVLDATGRLHATRKAAGVPARITVNADGLATGIWFVRVSNTDVQRTMRVPLVR